MFPTPGRADSAGMLFCVVARRCHPTLPGATSCHSDGQSIASRLLKTAIPTIGTRLIAIKATSCQTLSCGYTERATLSIKVNIPTTNSPPSKTNIRRGIPACLSPSLAVSLQPYYILVPPSLTLPYTEQNAPRCLQEIYREHFAPLYQGLVAPNCPNADVIFSFIQKRTLAQCQICFKVYADATGLSRHAKTHGPDAESRMHKCDHCPKRMWQMPNLRAHMRAIHTGEKPYKCPGIGCTYDSASAGCLSRHMRTCKILHGFGNVGYPVLPPKQLLPAIDAGTQLEGLIALPPSPQSDLGPWSPEELMSLSTSFKSDVDPSFQERLPTSPMFARQHSDLQATTSNEERFDIDAMEKWLDSLVPKSAVTDSFSFDFSFQAASPASSFSSTSTSFGEHERLSLPSPFGVSQSSTSDFTFDNTLATYPSTLELDAADTTVDSSFFLPINLSLVGDSSSLSLGKTEAPLSPFLFDSGLSPSSSSSLEQPSHGSNFEWSGHSIEPFPLI
ncbi:uncharacterized protein BT62DRAFT_1079262 [Guyanagaster necrorhizus]|uniref:C2H2-type domain-containing protein n=1 Tax=Guyanagaster necrorhizus TaxID=856835 RepID=A0A9P7VKY3_9AGAR|nr:uncharacterized protein BT62DRAFT_1079262 [Guyanagaster necrorhizus MCA 3950]KAG7442392.1 hypothetical protein BT62DRAFT_1079262 [Guyanagaster necrorhizus MCA 3950]